MRKFGLITPSKVTVIFNDLPGENLLQTDSETDFYTSWPVGKQWVAVMNHGKAGLGRLLPREERVAIEQELESIEGRFNEYLQKTQTQSPSILPLLLKRVKELQQRIYHHQGELHLTYPYFLPVLGLHLALLQANYQNRKDSLESLHELLFDSLSYLKDALDSAYEERYRDIVLKRSGPRNNLGYVEDTRNNKSLTEWVSYTQNKASLKALEKYLSAKLAVKYVEQIHFPMAWSVVDDFIEVLESTRRRGRAYSIQKAGEARIAEWKQVSETKTQAESFNTSLLMQPVSDESIFPEDPDGWDYVKEYYKTVTIGLIGDLPIPGAAALSAVTGLFVGWIFGTDQADLWKKYAEAIADYIAEEIAGLEKNDIENDLTSAEEEFDSICKYLDEQGWEVGQPLSDLSGGDEIETRLINLITDLDNLRQDLYHPYSSTYTTFPYFDRLFTLYGAVLGTGTTTLETYDTYDEFRELFEKSRDYLYRATSSAVDYRYDKIGGDYGGMTNVSKLYDGQSHSHFSDDRPLGSHDDRWDGYNALRHLMRVELGYVYPNRLKILAGIHNFDTMVAQYNEFWSQRKSDHVFIEPLWDEWADKVEEERNPANGGRGDIDYGYRKWSNGPGVHDHLYFSENAYSSHFHGPKIYRTHLGSI